MDTIAKTRSLDRRGKTITTFVVFDAAAELRPMAEGEVLELLTDSYPALRSDISVWCEAAGHVLLSVDETSTEYRFLIEKGAAGPKEERMAMVISADGLEELLSPLGFALGAALEGIGVSLYFQGPAVRVLARGFRPKLKGWARPFSRFAASSMTRSGHIPAQDKLRQLRALGAHLYVCAPSMDHFKVNKDDLIFEDLPMVGYLTFMAVMEEADIHLYI